MTFLSIIGSCTEHGVDSTSTSWIYAMLSSRIVSAKLGPVTITVTTTKGCPQGGVLPPLLYILVKDSLLKALNDAGYFSQSFADDLAVIVIGLYVSTLCELMQSAFRIIENWCNQHEQMVNTNKTKLTLFTTKRTITGFKPPKIFGKEILLSQSAKVLGMDFDPKINWNNHIQGRIRKATATLWSCRSAIGKNWGLSPKAMMWIYIAIVRPMLAYAAFIWWPRCKIEAIQKQLAKLQRLALLSITGAMKSTPTAALEALLNIEPLHIYVESMARATCLRLHQSSLLITSDYGHAALWNQMIKETPNLEMPFDSIVPAYRFDNKFQLYLPTRESWKNGTAINTSNCLTWYSDGSKTNNSSGAGIHCPELQINESFALGSFSSIFMAETFGITQCSNVLLHKSIRDRQIFICSDSQSALKAIAGYKIYSSMVLECRDNIQLLANTNTVTLVWVPGHSDIEGNETADELARAGAEAPSSSPEPILKIPPSFFKSHISRWKRTIFSKHWASINHARHAKNCIKICAKNTKYTLSLSRRNLKRITGVLTGHCNLNKHLFTIGRSNSPNCPNCGDEESAEHLLCKCPAYITARAKSFGAYILPHNNIWSLTPSSILDYLNRTNRI